MEYAQVSGSAQQLKRVDDMVPSLWKHRAAKWRSKINDLAGRYRKHQVGFSTSEISRRYVDTTPEMFLPDKWRKRAENVKQGSGEGEVLTMWHGTFRMQTPSEAADRVYEHALHVYEEMLDSGVAPEQARMVLPQAMITEQYKTGSLLGWYHLVSLRKDAHAQKEIQEAAKQIEEIMIGLFPKSWEALTNND